MGSLGVGVAGVEIDFDDAGEGRFNLIVGVMLAIGGLAGCVKKLLRGVYCLAAECSSEVASTRSVAIRSALVGECGRSEKTKNWSADNAGILGWLRAGV